MTEIIPGNSVQLRQATALDYVPLLELFDEIDVLHRNQLPQFFHRPDGPAREQEFFQEVLNDEKAVIFVIEQDADLVGFVHVIVKDSPPIPIMVPRRYAVIDTLMVRACSKHQGFGRMLVKTAEDWSKAMGATSVVLNVYEFNQSAISFYEKAGYQTLSRRMQKELME
jgi:diamine N-acetyltransferase